VRVLSIALLAVGRAGINAPLQAACTWQSCCSMTRKSAQERCTISAINTQSFKAKGKDYKQRAIGEFDVDIGPATGNPIRADRIS